MTEGPPSAGRSTITLDQAVEQTRSGDIWLFRGGTGADRAIQLATNAPVNHVALAVVIDDLPPMMWHAELGRRLLDLWTGTHHRGAQLHDLRAAVLRWTGARSQRVWLRQLHPEAGREGDDAMLRTVARWNGTSFPSTAMLAWRWFSGRSDLPRLPQLGGTRQEQAEAAYCAELAAITLESMGVLEPGRPTNWYDPGRFWSGDDLPLRDPWTFGEEIEVVVPPRG
ncbi:MAG: hypothetical protein U0R80_13485 [Nocardioidaceae bacterium]